MANQHTVADIAAQHREAIKLMLLADPTLSARELGRRRGITHITAGRYRKMLEAEGAVPVGSKRVNGSVKTVSPPSLPWANTGNAGTGVTWFQNPFKPATTLRVFDPRKISAITPSSFEAEITLGVAKLIHRAEVERREGELGLALLNYASKLLADVWGKGANTRLQPERQPQDACGPSPNRSSDALETNSGSDSVVPNDDPSKVYGSPTGAAEAPVGQSAPAVSNRDAEQVSDENTAPVASLAEPLAKAKAERQSDVVTSRQHQAPVDACQELAKDDRGPHDDRPQEVHDDGHEPEHVQDHDAVREDDANGDWIDRVPPGSVGITGMEAFPTKPRQAPQPRRKSWAEINRDIGAEGYGDADDDDYGDDVESVAHEQTAPAAPTYPYEEWVRGSLSWFSQAAQQGQLLIPCLNTDPVAIDSKVLEQGHAYRGGDPVSVKIRRTGHLQVSLLKVGPIERLMAHAGAPQR
jgi:hypothetical protein